MSTAYGKAVPTFIRSTLRSGSSAVPVRVAFINTALLSMQSVVAVRKTGGNVEENGQGRQPLIEYIL